MVILNFKVLRKSCFILPVLGAMGLALASAPAGAQSSGTLIQLIDPLDEPEFYCIDIPGFRHNLRLDRPLMTHTCKPGADDQMFTLDHPAKGQLFMAAYKLCLEADGTAPGSSVSMKKCSDKPGQRFVRNAQGEIRLGAGPGAPCLAMAPGKGEPTGGPSHLRRPLALQECTATRPSLKKWITPGARVLSD